jgi:hypothetical protein
MKKLQKISAIFGAFTLGLALLTIATLALLPFINTLPVLIPSVGLFLVCLLLTVATQALITIKTELL